MAKKSSREAEFQARLAEIKAVRPQDFAVSESTRIDKPSSPVEARPYDYQSALQYTSEQKQSQVGTAAPEVIQQVRNKEGAAKQYVQQDREMRDRTMDAVVKGVDAATMLTGVGSLAKAGLKMGTRLVKGKTGARVMESAAKQIGEGGTHVVTKADAVEANRFLDYWNPQRLSQFENVYGSEKAAKDMVEVAKIRREGTSLLDYNIRGERKSYLQNKIRNESRSQQIKKGSPLTSSEKIQIRKDAITDLDTKMKGDTYAQYYDDRIIFSGKGGNTVILHEDVHAQQLNKVHNLADEIIKAGEKPIRSVDIDGGYWDAGKEVYARVMEARKIGVDSGIITANTKLTDSNIGQLLLKLVDTNNELATSLLWYDKETIKALFNKLPAAVGIGSATAITNKNK